MKPQCIFVGPPRTGSTLLDRVLRESPSCCLPAHAKETFFLDRYYDKGWSWYEQQFFPVPDSPCLALEVSPTYFAHADARQRLVRDLPDCRVVICLRDPIERSLSHFQHLGRYGTFADCRKASEVLRKAPEILEDSRYRQHIQAWREALGDERLLFLDYGRLNSQPVPELESLAQALSIELPLGSVNFDERVNRATAPRFPRLAQMAKAVAEWLRARGLYRVLSLAGAVGLKRLFFSGQGRDEVGDLRQELKSLLENELAEERGWYRQWQAEESRSEPSVDDEKGP